MKVEFCNVHGKGVCPGVVRYWVHVLAGKNFRLADGVEVLPSISGEFFMKPLDDRCNGDCWVLL